MTLKPSYDLLSSDRGWSELGTIGTIASRQSSRRELSGCSAVSLPSMSYLSTTAFSSADNAAVSAAVSQSNDLLSPVPSRHWAVSFASADDQRWNSSRSCCNEVSTIRSCARIAGVERSETSDSERPG